VKASIGAQVKTLDPHSADAIGNAGDGADDSADPSVDVDKEKSNSNSDAKPTDQEQ